MPAQIDGEGFYNPSINELGLEDSSQQNAGSSNDLAVIQAKLSEMEKTINDSKNGYSKLNSSYDQVVKSYASLTKGIETAGLGKYDPATGSVILYQGGQPAQQSTPEAQVNPFTSGREMLDSRIEAETKRLYDKLEDGSITAEELQKDMAKYVKPLENEKLALFVKEQTWTPTENKTQSQSQTIDPAQQLLDSQFSQVKTQYPELEDTGSDLYKKAEEIYKSNPSKWGAANYGELDANGNVVKYTGNPMVRAELARVAAQALVDTGMITERLKQITGSNFHVNAGTGYTPPDNNKPSSYITNNQVMMLKTVGINDKKVVSYINKSMESYELGGKMVLT